MLSLKRPGFISIFTCETRRRRAARIPTRTGACLVVLDKGHADVGYRVSVGLPPRLSATHLRRRLPAIHFPSVPSDHPLPAPGSRPSTSRPCFPAIHSPREKNRRIFGNTRRMYAAHRVNENDCRRQKRKRGEVTQQISSSCCVTFASESRRVDKAAYFRRVLPKKAHYFSLSRSWGTGASERGGRAARGIGAMVCIAKCNGRCRHRRRRRCGRSRAAAAAPDTSAAAAPAPLQPHPTPALRPCPRRRSRPAPPSAPRLRGAPPSHACAATTLPPTQKGRDLSIPPFTPSAASRTSRADPW